MFAQGNWLSVEVKRKNGEDDDTEEFDLKVLEVLTRDYNRESYVRGDAEIKKELDKRAKEIYDGSEKRSVGTFPSKEAEISGRYVEDSGFMVSRRDVQAEEWVETYLVQAIACGLEKTASFIYNLYLTEQYVFPTSRTLLLDNKGLDMPEILEVLIRCFPRDQTGPMNAVVSIIKNAAKKGMHQKRFIMSYFGFERYSDYRRPLVDAVRTELDRRLSEPADDDDNDVTLSKRGKKPAIVSATPPVVPAAPQVVTLYAPPAIVPDINMGSLPLGEDIRVPVQIGDYFYKLVKLPVFSRQELYENWQVVSVIANRIVVIAKPQSEPFTDGQKIEVEYLVYRQNKYGTDWQVAVKLGAEKELYTAEELLYKPQLLEKFATQWRWAGLAPMSLIDTWSSLVDTSLVEQTEKVKLVTTAQAGSNTDPEYGFKIGAVDRLWREIPVVPYEVKVGDYFYFKSGDYQIRKEPQNVADNYTVSRVIRPWLVVISKPGKRSHFIEYNPNPNSRGSTWTPLLLNRATGLFSRNRGTKNVAEMESDYRVWYYSGENPGVVMEVHDEEANDDDNYSFDD
jgi:hypothetical protein